MEWFKCKISCFFQTLTFVVARAKGKWKSLFSNSTVQFISLYFEVLDTHNNNDDKFDWLNGLWIGYDDDNHEFDQSWSCCRCSKLAQQRTNLPEVVSIRAHLSCRPVLLWMAMSKQRSSRCQTNSTWFRLKNNHQNDGICLCSQLKWSSWCVHVLYEQNTGSPICWW